MRIVISFFCILLFYSAFSCGFDEKSFNKYIEKQSYSGKVVKIKRTAQGSSFYLDDGFSFGWRSGEYKNYHRNIETGDSLIKVNNERILTVIKPTKDTFFMDLSWNFSFGYRNKFEFRKYHGD